MRRLKFAKDLPDKNITLRKVISKSVEGQIFLYSLFTIFGYILFLIFGNFFFPELSHKIIALSTSHIFFGRAAALSLGYALEIPSWILIPLNFFMEMLIVAVFYPLFVLGYEHFVALEILKNFIEKYHSSFKKNEALIRKFGPIALIVFIWLPIWMTGPLVAAIIGYLIGMPFLINLTIVLLGTIFSALTWALFFRTLHFGLSQVHPLLSFIVFVAIVSFLSFHYFFLKRRKKLNKK